ncbi:hypothetical protein CK516_36370 [Nostoc sp. 'Peltigera malacea cyanobiont' DB3992]|nr:hypothetical protein CK516_36370 [Nostoc sp. 'Peltigera malacea cyanobiont' DB3992]
MFIIGSNFFTYPFNIALQSRSINRINIGDSDDTFINKIKKTYFDEFFGNLSYGLFLSHYLVIFEFEKLEIQWNSKWILLMLLFSTFISAVGFFCFEKPVIAWRKKIRNQHN